MQVLSLRDNIDKSILAYISFHCRYTKTYIWDVADLEVPTLMNTYYSSQRSIDHNQYVLGNLTYQSNYLVSIPVSLATLKFQINSDLTK